MTTSSQTPYEILGVPVDIDFVPLRIIYRQAIHDYKQKKISDDEFRRKIRAYETLSDSDKRSLYDSRQEWISDLPLTKYTPQQLAAESALILILQDRLRDANLKSINAQDSRTGHTALYCAARAGNVAGVEFLTEFGAEPDLSQRTKSTALHAASFFGHADVVRCLLESGADYRIQNEGKRMAENEAFNNEITKTFTELKQQPYVRAAANELEWFQNNVLNQHIDEMYFSQRQTLLHCAAKKGHFELVKLLRVKFSADLNIVDVNGNSALHLAAYGGHEKIVDYLLNQGCDPTLRNRWTLTAEQEGSGSKLADKISQIFQCIRNRNIFETARNGHVWWFEYYYQMKSLDAIDSNGVSLLYHSCRDNQYDVVKWLLDHGANINIKLEQSPKSTSLHVAKYYGHYKIVELLLEHGADVTIKNDFRANVFEESYHSTVDSNIQSQINNLLSKHQSNLTGRKILDVYIYLDQDTGDNQEVKLQLKLNSDYNQLVEALPNVLKNKLGYFSIAKRRIFFEKPETTILSAVCRTRYANSKFIEMPLRLTLHEDSSKKMVTPRYARSDPKFDFRDFTRVFQRNAKLTSSTLIPSNQKQFIKIGNLQFTFSESAFKENVKFSINTVTSPDPNLFGIPGCLYLFEIVVCTDTSEPIELPLVSVINNLDACLYTLASPYWFRSNNRRTRLPMLDGIHAFVQHVSVIPILLTLPGDMVLAASLDKPLIKRDKPVKCTCIVLQEHDKVNFEKLAYHGTSIAVVRSILTDGLVAPGTVVTTTGKRIMPPSIHIPRGRSAFDISDFADAIFLSPSVHYSSDPCYAVPFSHDDQQLIPVLECGVKKDCFCIFPCTVPKYVTHAGDNRDAIEWRLQDPEHVVINCVLFIPTVESTEATAHDRLKKFK